VGPVPGVRGNRERLAIAALVVGFVGLEHHLVALAAGWLWPL
jgi:hypothetical protein